MVAIYLHQVALVWQGCIEHDRAVLSMWLSPEYDHMMNITTWPNHCLLSLLLLCYDFSMHKVCIIWTLHKHNSISQCLDIGDMNTLIDGYVATPLPCQLTMKLYYKRKAVLVNQYAVSYQFSFLIIMSSVCNSAQCKLVHTVPTLDQTSVI